MRTFVITGANRGIGLGLTREALRFGHRVVATCRHPDAARDLWELERDYPERVILKALDVADPASLEAFTHDMKSMERVDTLINNAGVIGGPNERLASLSAKEVEQAFRVNTLGPILVTKAVMPALLASPKPVVASLSSLMGSIADNEAGGMYAYRISKAGLNMFNRSLAHEFPKAICVVLHPGWVQTEMGGARAPVTVQDSTSGLYQVITRLKPEDSGRFFDYQGKPLPW